MGTVEDNASKQDDDEYADFSIRKESGSRYADDTKAESGGYARLKERTNAGGGMFGQEM